MRRSRFARVVVTSIVTWAVLGLLVWLDRRTAVSATRADIFSAIWIAIEAVGTWVGDAGAAIATTLYGAVTYIASALAWLGGRVADILVSTGQMFAKVWDGLRVVWNDVLKPALVWVDQQLTRFEAWLKDTFKPVFDFLARVRGWINDIYNRFVKPIVDTIEFLRQLDRLLAAFHIHFLDALAGALQTIEQRIEEPFLWINQKLNEIWNALDLIVTADGFFQRLTLIHSMSRYVPSWLRIATAARQSPLSGDAQYALEAHGKPQNTDDLVDQLALWTAGEQNDTGDAVDAAVQRALDFTTGADGGGLAA